MLDEEMDDIIRRAAENHHPAYNDKAWEMMEMKLDKHLPQKKDRKKLIFFLLLFPLLGAAIFVTVNNFNKYNRSSACISSCFSRKSSYDRSENAGARW
jgi:hypothetical protein